MLTYQPESCQVFEEMHNLCHCAWRIEHCTVEQFIAKAADMADFAVNASIKSILPHRREHLSIMPLLMVMQKRGVTIMEMVKEMDAGDMVSRFANSGRRIMLVPCLGGHWCVSGRDLLQLRSLFYYIAVENQACSSRCQSGNVFRQYCSGEERLDWNKPARDIFNQIRGMYPWPVAHTLFDGKRFKIYEADFAVVKDRSYYEKPRRGW